MSGIVLYDLCCKAGGCSVGYYRAAKALGKKITIVGVDIEPQPNYPYDFVLGDAVEFLKHNQNCTHIHASPPCQEYTKATANQRKQGKKYTDITEPMSKLMYETGKPGVMENVMQAPIRPDIILRGDVFGLKVIRKRKFELINWWMMQPEFPRLRGKVKDGDFVSVFGNANLQKDCKRLKGFEDQTIIASWKHAMGIDWMSKDYELSNAIPPAYTEYIGIEFFKNGN